jgi:hypothetical protein
MSVAFPNSLVVDLTHRFYVLPFLVGIDIARVSSSFHFDFTTKIFNSISYVCTFATSEDTNVNEVAFYVIGYDQTDFQSTQTEYFDTLFFTANNNVADSYSLIASDAANFHAGINSFHYATGEGVNFIFNAATKTLAASTNYVFINITTWNYRMRNCNAPDLYYIESVNTCYSVCPSSSVANGTYKFCVLCHFSCQYCSAATATSCTNCGGTRFFHLGACPCSTGYYETGTTLCGACGATCNTCTNSTTCATCANAGMTVGASGCVCNNPATFFHTGSKTCQSCGSGCATCTSSTVCTSCKNATATTVAGGTCTCTQLATFYDSTGNNCTACGNSCATCTSLIACSSCTGANMVVSGGNCVCDARFYPNGAVCSSCAPLCQTCVGPSICDSCISGILTPSLTYSCVCIAPSNFYDSGSGTCESCGSGCADCSSLTTCTTCKNTTAMTVTGGTCTCTQAATFYDSIGNNCSACGSLCATCTSLVACSGCTGANLVVSGGYCVCDTTYYLNGSSCASCMPICLTCSNSSTCSSCDSGQNLAFNSSTNLCDCTGGLFLSGNTCVSNCPVGYFASERRCNEICGDGKLFDLECDDGNL